MVEQSALATATPILLCLVNPLGVSCEQCGYADEDTVGAKHVDGYTSRTRRYLYHLTRRSYEKTSQVVNVDERIRLIRFVVNDAGIAWVQESGGIIRGAIREPLGGEFVISASRQRAFHVSLAKDSWLKRSDCTSWTCSQQVDRSIAYQLNGGVAFVHFLKKLYKDRGLSRPAWDFVFR